MLLKKPVRALAKATWYEIDYLERGRKEKKGEKAKRARQGKRRSLKTSFRGKSCRILGMLLDAEWQGAAKGAGTFVLCSFRWPGRRSVGLCSTASTPRGRVCACTDIGSLTTRETNRCCHPCLQSVSSVMVARATFEAHSCRAVLLLLFIGPAKAHHGCCCFRHRCWWTCCGVSWLCCVVWPHPNEWRAAWVF